MAPPAGHRAIDSGGDPVGVRGPDPSLSGSGAQIYARTSTF